MGTGRLELEDSTVSGGIVVQPGGELDLDHTLFSTNPTANKSTVNGDIKITNPRDIDINNTTVNGGVMYDGGGTNPANATPSICGSTIHGGVTLKNVAQGFAGGLFIGDPGPEGFNCTGNDIRGSVQVSDSTGVIEIEGNSIKGSVFITNSRYELASNTITGSASCVNSTHVSDGDSAPNTVGGKNTC
jgi:hypothetical protein